MRFLDQVEKSVADALAEFGRIDALFNDAGTTRPGDVVSVSLEDWEMVLDVNLRGTFNVSRAVLPHMLERGSGAIINMGSVDGLTGDRNMAAYNAAKAAVVNLSRSMAVDFGPRGIRTNCICPGVIGSPAILKTFTDEAARADGTGDAVAAHRPPERHRVARGVSGERRFGLHQRRRDRR